MLLQCIKGIHACCHIVPDDNGITQHESADAACSTCNEIVGTRDGRSQMLEFSTIKNAVMLIVYLASKGLQMCRWAAPAGTGLPQLILPAAHLYSERMRPQPETC